MENGDIPLEINIKNFTITLTEARKVMPEIQAYKYLILGNVIRPDTNELVEARLLVIPDEGISS